MDIDEFPQWHFGEDEETANETLAKILDGRKRMTSQVYRYMETEPDLPLEEQPAYPVVGNMNVITDWAGVPKCVIRTTDVRIMEFDRIPFEIARLENGDASLEDWQTSREIVLKEEFYRMQMDFGMEEPFWNGSNEIFLEIFEVVEFL
jgi:uncharacterized protein YhfF